MINNLQTKRQDKYCTKEQYDRNFEETFGRKDKRHGKRAQDIMGGKDKGRAKKEKNINHQVEVLEHECDEWREQALSARQQLADLDSMHNMAHNIELLKALGSANKRIGELSDQLHDYQYQLEAYRKGAGLSYDEICEWIPAHREVEP